MRNYFQDKKNILIAAILLIVVAVIILIIFSFKKDVVDNQPVESSKSFKGRIINDNIKIPDTTNVNNNEGEIVPRGEYSIKLQPQSETEQVFISKAKLTIKEAYVLAEKEADKWSGDQKLIFIKSNGALGLDGMASSWQLIYGSSQKEKGYEIIISADKIISTKEINSEVGGFDLPVGWYDSSMAIASLQNLPQFKDETISAISFYYSQPASSWAYGLANGQKTTSMWVK